MSRNLSQQYANPQQQRLLMEQDAARAQRHAASQKAQQRLMAARNEIAQHLIRKGQWADAKMLPTPVQISSSGGRDLQAHEERLNRIADSAGFQPKQEVGAMRHFEPKGTRPKAAIPAQPTPETSRQMEDRTAEGTAGALDDQPKGAEESDAGTAAALDEQDKLPGAQGESGIEGATGPTGRTGKPPMLQSVKRLVKSLPSNATAPTDKSTGTIPAQTPKASPLDGLAASQPAASAFDALPGGVKHDGAGYYTEILNPDGSVKKHLAYQPTAREATQIREKNLGIDKLDPSAPAGDPYGLSEKGRAWLDKTEPRSLPEAERRANEIKSAPLAGLDPGISNAVQIDPKYGGGVGTAKAGPPDNGPAQPDWKANARNVFAKLPPNADSRMQAYTPPASAGAPAQKTEAQWHSDVVAKYPQVGVAGTPENLAFVKRYKEFGMRGEQNMAHANELFGAKQASVAVAASPSAGPVTPQPPLTPSAELQRTQKANDPKFTGYDSPSPQTAPYHGQNLNLEGNTITPSAPATRPSGGNPLGIPSPSWEDIGNALTPQPWRPAKGSQPLSALSPDSQRGGDAIGAEGTNPAGSAEVARNVMPSTGAAQAPGTAMLPFESEEERKRRMGAFAGLPALAA